MEANAAPNTPSPFPPIPNIKIKSNKILQLLIITAVKKRYSCIFVSS